MLVQTVTLRDPGRLHRARRIVPPLVALTLALVIAACGGGDRGQSATGGAEGDTVAYRSATGLTDATAREAALEVFLGNYPESSFRGRVYSRLYDLKAEKSAEEAATFVRRRLAEEKHLDGRAALHYALYTHAKEHQPAAQAQVIQDLLDAPAPLEFGIYNGIGWDLAVRGEALDTALELAERAVAKAPDSLAQATVLDTKGWVQYKREEYTEAVETLKAASAISPEPFEEIEVHLTMAYDAAGMKQKARDRYVDLLITQENPEFRQRVSALTGELGGSAAQVFTEIDERREAAAFSAPDFTLKDYADNEVKLSDFRGKIVLLNFWHPT
jgi:tetratricopeptide (TPR) repeat protein